MFLFLRKNIGWFTIFAVSVVPIIVWARILPLSIRFLDINAVTTSLGQIFGLLGMTLFSVNLILSSRLKILDEYFYGLNHLYIYHRFLGALSFCLLLFHPLFLVVKYIRFSLREAALFFVPSFANAPVGFGIIALSLMIVLLFITFFVWLKYQNWKLTHKFMVVVFIFAVLHAVYISSDISRDNFLRFYILGLAGLGLALGFYQAFLRNFFNKNLEYRVKKINRLGQGILEIEMEPLAEALRFEPGQFIFVKFKSKHTSPEVHPFSVSSAEADNNLKIAVKSLGDFTENLVNLQPNDAVMIEGPFGKFSRAEAENKNQIWIAGGIGITPFLSMARDLDGSYNIDLYYCVRAREEAVFLPELSRISSAGKGLNVIVWPSEEKGRIDAGMISRESGGFQDKDIFLCGPDSLMKGLKKQFKKLKIKNDRVHSEEFKFL